MHPLWKPVLNFVIAGTLGQQSLNQALADAAPVAALGGRDPLELIAGKDVQGLDELGVDLKVLVDVFSAGGANSVMFQWMKPWIVDGDDSHGPQKGEQIKTFHIAGRRNCANASIMLQN